MTAELRTNGRVGYVNLARGLRTFTDQLAEQVECRPDVFLLRSRTGSSRGVLLRREPVAATSKLAE